VPLLSVVHRESASQVTRNAEDKRNNGGEILFFSMKLPIHLQRCRRLLLLSMKTRKITRNIGIKQIFFSLKYAFKYVCFHFHQVLNLKNIFLKYFYGIYP